MRVCRLTSAQHIEAYGSDCVEAARRFNKVPSYYARAYFPIISLQLRVKAYVPQLEIMTSRRVHLKVLIKFEWARFFMSPAFLSVVCL